MKKIHIAVLPQQGKGHIYPALGLCAELVRRGYHVTQVVLDRFAKKVLETGAEPVVFEIREEEWRVERRYGVFDLPPQDPNWWSMLGPQFFIEMATVSTSTFLRVKDFYSKNVPDLILYDRFAFAGAILSRYVNCPAIQIFPHFAPYRNFLFRENGIFINPEPALEASATVDRILAKYGIKERNNLWRNESLNIYFVPEAFQYEINSFDERFCFVGACLNRPIEHVWKNSSVGKKIILVSSQCGLADSRYYNTIVDALSGSAYHVILSLGEHVAESALKRIPENFETNQNASLLEILPHAALLICQGGMGTTLEAIYHGVPVVTVPMMPFTEDVAHRVAELGIGIYLLGKDLTVDTIKVSVDRAMSDTAIHDRVKQMQREFRCSGGEKAASDKIEAFLSSKLTMP